MTETFQQEVYYENEAKITKHSIKPRFLERVMAIPLMQNTVTKVNCMIPNTVSEFVLSKANITLAYATHTPYYTLYIQPQLEKVDDFGCRTLDHLQPVEKVLDRLLPHPLSDILQTLPGSLKTLLKTFESQLLYLQQEWARPDLDYSQKINSVAHHIQDQFIPLLETITLQLNSYSFITRPQ